MTEIVRQLARILPFRRKKPLLEDPTPELMGIQYGCDGCCKGIEEGSIRYTCGECAASFDLCASCHDSGEGKKHTDTCGHLHEFHVETRNDLSTSRLVMAVRLEETVINMFYYYAERPCIGVYVESKNRYEYLKYKEVGQLVFGFASALHTLMSSGHVPMVALCSAVRLEWYVADYACCILGLPTVGITASSDKNTTSFILSQSESSLVVCSIDLLPVFLEIGEETCETLKEIVVMDLNENEQARGDALPKPVRSDLRVWLLSDLITSGGKTPVDMTLFKTDPETIYTISYTSGSTGNPKGCVFSRRLWLSHMNVPLAFLFGTKRIWFSFQPPSHMMERESFHLTLCTGNKAAMYRGSMEHLFEDMRMTRPTVVASTPRFFSSIYNEFLQDLYQEYQAYYQEVKTSIENSSSSCGEQSEASDSVNEKDSVPDPIPPAPPIPSTFPKKRSLPPSPSPETLMLLEEFDPFKVPYAIRDKVKQKYKKYLGGREQLIAVGGAAVPKELKMFLSFCFDAIVQEGYGTTEAGSICNGEWSMGDVTIRLRDVPEMGYLTTDKPPRGEVCVKTKHMISGYYKNKEETEEKFQDGFFCTGDIGVMDSPGHVIVIDRKKNIFKLAQGEFVAPERIEGLYESLCNLIEQVYLYGNIYRSNVVGVVVPHGQALIQWKRKQLEGEREKTKKGEEGEGIVTKEEGGVSEQEVKEKDEGIDQNLTVADLCYLPEVYELFMAELRTLGQANGLQGWEIPAAIILEPHPFTVDNKLLTCTLKKSRPQLEKRFKVKLEELYDKMDSSRKGTSLIKNIEQEIFGMFLSELSSRGVTLPLDTLLEFTPSSSSPPNISLSLTQVGGDSLSAMHLSNLISKHLSVEVSAMTILKEPLIVTLQCLVTALSGHMNADDIILHQQSQDFSNSSIDWEVEADISFLEDAVVDRTGVNGHNASEKKTVLLTGGTGFLGRFLLWELLSCNSVGTVYCLARSNKGSSAAERVFGILKTLLKELLVESNQDRTFARLTEKLVVFESDISRPQLGLKEDEYSRVKTEVDLVIHNGANVNHVLQYNDLKRSNVNSTKEILKLCTEPHPKALHYVSTIGVFAAFPSEVISEESIPSRSRLHTLSGYSQSKWVSEQLVIQAVRKGLINSKCCISRPGLIGAHSETGHPNLSDWFFLLVNGINCLRRYPTGSPWDSGYTDIIPVDRVANAIVTLSLAGEVSSLSVTESVPSIYHLINAGSLGTASVCDIVRSLEKTQGPLKPLDNGAFLSLLSEEASKEGSDHRVVSLHLLLSHGHSLFCSARPTFSNRATQTTLEQFGIDMNGPLSSYMDRYVHYLHKNIFQAN